MVSSKCFVTGCKTGYETDKRKRKAEGKGTLSLFRVPREPDKLQKWKEAIPRSDRELNRNDKVCELHFFQKDISRYFIHKMPDGTQVFIKKEKISLKANAVPSLFPNLPSNLTKNKKKRKSSIKRMPFPKKAKRKNTQLEEISICKTESLFTFNDLLKDVSQVRKPNKLWAVSSHEDFIMCVKWNLKFAPERQVVIDANLNIKVMYCGTQVSIMSDTIIESVESLSLIIEKVNKYGVCPGAIKGNKICSIYMEYDWKSFGRPPKWCIGCRRNNLNVHLKKTPSICFEI